MKEQVKRSLPRLSRGTKTPAMHFGVALLAAGALVIAFQQDAVVRAQDVMRPLASLKTVPTPEPKNLMRFVRDRAAAIVLGKALFWDQQVGSDGQACASCHFHAGADSRSKNQLDPGLRAFPNPDTKFTPPFGPNYQVKANDFPFHRLANPDDRDSTVLFDTNDIMSSQGVRNFTFTAIVPGRRNDAGVSQPDPVFNVGGVNVRRVEPRNTPTMINAVFNFRNFWDGRARNEFNGVSPIGDLDPDVFVLRATANGLEKVQLRRDKNPDLVLEDSSLASQAVGPPLSDLEMSFAGRTFPTVGKKMVPRRALALQQVSPEDSVLGPYSSSPMRGINKHYRELIQAAFQPEWWQSNMLVQADGSIISSHQEEGAEAAPNEFTLMEFNFSLFWGLAIQMFEATLVANDSRVDQFLEGNKNALNPQEQLGMEVFLMKGKCFNCHGGPELTNASVVNVRDNEKLERMIMGDGNVAVYDNGFYNTAVTFTGDDRGVGATIGPKNLPLSNSRFFQLPQNIANAPTPKDRPNVPSGPLQPNERVAVDGAQKTPGLRNVELTAPYFHNGGMSTLEQVVEFYNRGGNFAQEDKADFDIDIEPLHLTAEEKAALVAFLKALTDERVRFDKAPFDHPQLIVPNGAKGNQFRVINDGTGNAKENFLRIPAVGRNGLKKPLSNFLERQAEPEEGEETQP